MEEWNREENDVTSNLTKEQNSNSNLVEEKKTENDKALTEVQDEKSSAEGQMDKVEEREKDINSNTSAVHREVISKEEEEEEEEDVVDDAVAVTAEEV